MPRSQPRRQVNDNKKCLNLGGGKVKQRNNWLVLDALNGDYFNIDFVIPLGDDSVDFIYSSMLFEHLNEDEVSSLLLECRRVLKKNGAMRLVVPDNLVYIKRYFLNDNMFFERIVGIYCESWERYGIAKTLETMLVAAISSIDNMNIVCDPGSLNIEHKDDHIIAPFPPHRYLPTYYCGPPPEIADSVLIAENLSSALSHNYTSFLDWIFMAATQSVFVQDLRFNSCHKSWWDRNRLESLFQANKIKMRTVYKSEFRHGLGAGLEGDIEKEDHSEIGMYIDALFG